MPNLYFFETSSLIAILYDKIYLLFSEELLLRLETFFLMDNKSLFDENIFVKEIFGRDDEEKLPENEWFDEGVDIILDEMNF